MELKADAHNSSAFFVMRQYFHNTILPSWDRESRGRSILTTKKSMSQMSSAYMNVQCTYYEYSAETSKNSTVVGEDVAGTEFCV